MAAKTQANYQTATGFLLTDA